MVLQIDSAITFSTWLCCYQSYPSLSALVQMLWMCYKVPPRCPKRGGLMDTSYTDWMRYFHKLVQVIFLVHALCCHITTIWMNAAPQIWLSLIAGTGDISFYPWLFCNKLMGCWPARPASASCTRALCDAAKIPFHLHVVMLTILVRMWVWYCSIGLWLWGVFQPNQEKKCLRRHFTLLFIYSYLFLSFPLIPFKSIQHWTLLKANWLFNCIFHSYPKCIVFIVYLMWLLQVEACLWSAVYTLLQYTNQSINQSNCICIAHIHKPQFVS